MTTTTTEETPLVFDFEAHEAEAEARSEALSKAEEAEATALADAEAKAEALEEVEAELGSGTVTPAALSKARTASEIATAIADQATTARKAAQRKVDNINTDTDLAAALVPLARRLVHESVPILALPSPLQVDPDLSDLRPTLVIRQQQAAHHDSNGFLSSYTGEKPAGRDKPVLLELYFIKGLHFAPSGADVFEVAPRVPVGLHARQPHDIRSTDTTYVGARGETVTKRTIPLNVRGVLPELPELGQADPNTVATHVRRALEVPFSNAGGPRPYVTVAPHGIARTTTSAGVTSSTVTVTADALSRMGKHEDHAEWIRGVVARLDGQGIAGAGRVRSARLVDVGRPQAEGSHWGFSDVLIEVTTEYRHA